MRRVKVGLEGLGDVFKEGVDGFEADREPDGLLADIHTLPLFVGEGTEDGTGGVYGEGFVVKKVGGSSDKP